MGVWNKSKSVMFHHPFIPSSTLISCFFYNFLSNIHFFQLQSQLLDLFSCASGWFWGFTVKCVGGEKSFLLKKTTTYHFSVLVFSPLRWICSQQRQWASKEIIFFIEDQGLSGATLQEPPFSSLSQSSSSATPLLIQLMCQSLSEVEDRTNCKPFSSFSTSKSMPEKQNLLKNVKSLRFRWKVSKWTEVFTLYKSQWII